MYQKLTTLFSICMFLFVPNANAQLHLFESDDESLYVIKGYEMGSGTINGEIIFRDLFSLDHYDILNKLNLPYEKKLENITGSDPNFIVRQYHRIKFDCAELTYSYSPHRLNELKKIKFTCDSFWLELDDENKSRLTSGIHATKLFPQKLNEMGTNKASEKVLSIGIILTDQQKNVALNHEGKPSIGRNAINVTVDPNSDIITSITIHRRSY